MTNKIWLFLTKIYKKTPSLSKKSNFVDKLSNVVSMWFESHPRLFCIELVCSPEGSSKWLGILKSKKINVRLVDFSKLAYGLNVCKNCCLSSVSLLCCFGLRTSRVHHNSHLMTALHRQFRTFCIRILLLK